MAVNNATKRASILGLGPFRNGLLLLSADSTVDLSESYTHLGLYAGFVSSSTPAGSASGEQPKLDYETNFPDGNLDYTVTLLTELDFDRDWD